MFCDALKEGITDALINLQHTPESVQDLARKVWLDWVPVLNAWATHRRCELVEAFCGLGRGEIRAFPFSISRPLVQISRWCPHCAARILTHERLNTGNVAMNMCPIMAFCKTLPESTLPRWVELLLPHISVSFLVDQMTARHARTYLSPRLASRPADQALNAILGLGPVSGLVHNLRKLSLAFRFQDIVRACMGSVRVAAQALTDRDWPAVIRVDHAEALKYCRRVPDFAPCLAPEDICRLDAARWPRVGLAAATMLALTPLYFFEQNHSAWGYVMCGRAGLTDKRKKLAGRVAHTLILCTLRPGPWSKLNSWIIKHITSFLF